MLKVLAFSFFAVMPSPVNAQSQCADPKEIVKELADKYGETIQYVMKSGDGRLIVFLANVTTGTWTQMIADGVDRLCMLGAGTDFKAAPQGEPV
jgi:hypothetical protein